MKNRDRFVYAINAINAVIPPRNRWRAAMGIAYSFFFLVFLAGLGLGNIFTACARFILQKAPLAVVITTTRTPDATDLAKRVGAWKEVATHVDKVARVPVVMPKDLFDVLFLQVMSRISAKKWPMKS